jgi:hypothetical protein
MPMTSARLARAHGTFNAVSGLWPILHMRSFEWLLGPKVDRWLVHTVAGLLVSNGLVQLTAARSDEAQSLARRLGLGTAATLAVIDVVYVTRRRISARYLWDAAIEVAWMAAWTRVERSRHG